MKYFVDRRVRHCMTWNNRLTIEPLNHRTTTLRTYHSLGTNYANIFGAFVIWSYNRIVPCRNRTHCLRSRGGATDHSAKCPVAEGPKVYGSMVLRLFGSILFYIQANVNRTVQLVFILICAKGRRRRSGSCLQLIKLKAELHLISNLFSKQSVRHMPILWLCFYRNIFIGNKSGSFFRN